MMMRTMMTAMMIMMLIVNDVVYGPICTFRYVLFLWVCIYIYIYFYIYIYIKRCVYIYTHTYIYIYVCPHMCLFMFSMHIRKWSRQCRSWSQQRKLARLLQQAPHLADDSYASRARESFRNRDRFAEFPHVPLLRILLCFRVVSRSSIFRNSCIELVVAETRL